MAQPDSVRALFFTFNSLALRGFGGVLPWAQHVLVDERGWLERDEFVELLSLAQVLPGPNICNLALMIGDRYFGLRGALAALAGMLSVPLLVVLALAVLYAQYQGHPQVAGALRGMGAVAGGLVAATGIKLIAALRTHPLGLRACLALVLLMVALIAWWRLPLVGVLLGVGLPACALTWRKIAP